VSPPPNTPPDPPHADDPHGEACRAGRDRYVDPTTGYEVFTRAFLARRGACCGNGCRHCPYEPRWSGKQGKLRTGDGV
jgi:hypothetical protein